MPTPPATASEAYQQLEHEAHLLMDRLMRQPPRISRPFTRNSAVSPAVWSPSAPDACVGGHWRC